MNGEFEDLGRVLAGLTDNLVLLESIDSTHLTAQRLVEQMDEEGLDLAPTVILARRQSQGLGRGERTWTSPDQGLYLNWLRSGLEVPTVALLPMLAATAAHHALREAGVQDLSIKWPNDLLVEGAKIAGILVHARHSESAWATVGLGINLTGAPLIDVPGARPATAVGDHVAGAQGHLLRFSIAADFLCRFNAALSDPLTALETWKQELMHATGDRLSVRLASGSVVDGRLVGLTEEGFLRLETGDGEQTITGGDIVET